MTSVGSSSITSSSVSNQSLDISSNTSKASRHLALCQTTETSGAMHNNVVWWWHGVAATRCVESTKLLYGGPG